MNKISIIIVDKNYRFIKSAITFLSDYENFKIIGGALSTQVALDMIKTNMPEVIIVDQSFTHCPKENFMLSIKKVSPFSKVIISGIDDFQEYKDVSLLRGAEAYISKSQFGEEIIPLIELIVKQAAIKNF